jgi:glycosyltransferase involved in cell wall biosynthesis
MRLSFVVPAYNEEHYLGACLDSILREIRGSAVAIEVIVVNNASTDATRAVALRYPEVKLIDEPRKGLTYARQAGLDACRGELIANVDADSRLPPGWLRRVLDEFGSTPELLALSGPLVYYDLRPLQSMLVQVFYWLAWAIYIVCRYLLRVGSMVQGGNFVVSRSAMEQIGGFDVSIAFYGEDTDIARRLSARGKVRFRVGLKMLSSARRLKKEGVLRMAWRYSLNYFWTTFFERPFTQEYVDIREEVKG